MPTDWLRYANQGATRNQPISAELSQRLGGILPNMGVTMEVFSGGQPGKGSGLPRVGSTRHDHGSAADVLFYQNGRRLNWANPQDVPLFQDIVKQAKAAGVTGFGAGPGYMREGSMHIGMGNPGVWGAGGRAQNAPSWLAEAYGGAPTGQPARATPTPTAPASLGDMYSQMAGATATPDAGLGLAGQAGTTVDPNSMLLGNVAAIALQNFADRTQRRRAEEEAEQARRTALFGGGGLGDLYG